MTKDKKKSGTALAAPRSYDVGYGKPPEGSRFRKGQSGNPRGRPKGARNKLPGLHEERLKDIILNEAYRGIAVRDGDRTVTIPMAQAIVRAMAVNAAKGQHRAQRLFAELLSSTEAARRRLNDEWLDTAITYKVEWEKELRRRAALGITDLPDPIPHPDHVKLNMAEGTAQVLGPMTAEEKAEWDDLVHMKKVLVDGLSDLHPMLETATDPEEIARIRDFIDQGEDALGHIKRVIPD